MSLPHRHRSLLLIPCLLLVSGTHAAEYFVATDGDDLAPGSRDAPFATVGHALSRLKAGDTCVIRGGTYREAVDVRLSGTPTKPIHIRAAVGETRIYSGSSISLQAKRD